MTKLRELTLPIIGGAGLLCLATPAIAHQQEIVVIGSLEVPEGYEPVTKKVSIQDLDLSTVAGEDEMESRVAAAIKSICSSHPKPARWQVKEAERCSEFAWAGARPQMDEALQKARGG